MSPLRLFTFIIFRLSRRGARKSGRQSYLKPRALTLGILGYFLKKGGYPVAPIVLGLILGGMLEENFRRAVKLAGGNYFVFFTKPIALAFIALAVVSVILPFLKKGNH